MTLLTIGKVLFAVFGVLDPVGNVPLYMSLTAKMDRATKLRIARKALLRASVILLIFIFLGSLILELFQISIESFRIAGGVIMSLVGLEIVFGFTLGGKHEAEEGASVEDISIVPLATPLLAGPGMITTCVIMAHAYGYLMTMAAVGLNLALEYVLFYEADLILKILGREGALIFAKVSGLILTTIGVEFIRSGL